MIRRIEHAKETIEEFNEQQRQADRDVRTFNRFTSRGPTRLEREAQMGTNKHLIRGWLQRTDPMYTDPMYMHRGYTGGF